MLTEIFSRRYFPRQSGWIFIFLLISISLFYNYQHILFMPPQSMHQWRQCDCLSLTLNYYQDHNPFLKPAVHDLGVDGTGKTISEFPVIYYSVAQLWKTFGYHEYIYRLIILLFYFVGLYFLFKLTEDLLKDSLLAIFTAILMFTSPTLIYYGNNFLMDIPAFSLALAGLYFFFRFYESSRNRDLYIMVLCYIFAGLLKVSSLLSFGAILGLFMLEVFRIKIKPGGKIFPKPAIQIIPLMLVVLVQVVWYNYAIQYNTRHNGGMFLIGYLPVWNLNAAQVKETVDSIIDHLRIDYFRLETEIAFLIMLAFIIVFNKNTGKILLLLLSLLLAGMAVFIILFFQALKDHDYYTINLFNTIPVLLMCFFQTLRERFGKIFHSPYFSLALIAFLIYNIHFASVKLEERYRPDSYLNSYYSVYLQPLRQITPYLRSIGIGKDDKVISLSDNSINISLYLMNQKGWTNYIIQGDSALIQKKIGQGARYLFIIDPTTYAFPKIGSFLKNQVGSYKNIHIYSLRPGIAGQMNDVAP